MATPNYEQSGSQKEWFAKYRWFILLGLALLVVVVYRICTDPTTTTVRSEDLAFNPLGGTAVNDSLGNKDGQLNPGEQVRVRIRLTNTGEKPIPAFDLVLAAQDTGVTFINNDNRVHFDDIAVKETALSEDVFEFKLSETYLFDCLSFTSRFRRPAMAGLIGNAYAAGNGGGGDGGPTIDMYVFPIYRVCLGPCSLEVGPDETDPAILRIDVGLCNSGPSSLSNLTDARVKIKSVNLCVPPFATFSPLDIEGELQDELDYGNVNINECEPPSVPTNRFIFSAPGYIPTVGTTTLCVYFGVEIYSASTLIGDRNMGVRAQVVFREITPEIAALPVRPQRQ